jgi:hypothetical protein
MHWARIDILLVLWSWGNAVRVSLGRVMVVEEIKIFGWLSLKSRETTLAAKKILLSTILASMLGVSRIHRHAADRIFHQTIIRIEAMSIHWSCMRMLVFSTVSHRRSL